jgi:hypothetical protein
MPRNVELGPINIVVGTVTISLGYDPNDHSIIKGLVVASGAQALTEFTVPRNGNGNQVSVLSAVVVADQQAINQQIAQGGPVGAVLVPKTTSVAF